MAQRAATFARRPSGTRAAERARSMGEPAGAPVALDIRSLLVPYKRHRGLSIRVERLLHGARLTQGRNNGDRSWSLLPDDLEDLEYLPATAAYEAHTLAVRIISVDGGDGETLAVLDLPIAAVAPVETPKPEASPAAAANANDEEIAKLREELSRAEASLTSREAELSRTASMLAEKESELSKITSSLTEREAALTKATSALAARDVELSVARKRAEDAEKLRGVSQADLAAARQSWERELQNRLSAAAVESKQALDKARAEWEAEHRSQTSRADAGTTRAVEDVRRRAREELDAALSKARSDWKAAEAARFSAAEAVLRDEASKTIKDLKSRADAAEKALVEATTLLNQNRGKDADDMRRRAREELDAALSKARSDWKTAEAARFSAAEAVWREEASKTAADLRARAETAEKALSETTAALSHARGKETEEVRRLREELTQAQSDLTSRRAELAEARAAAERARKAGSDATTELRKAEEARKSAEIARIASIEARWKEQSDRTAGELTSRLEQTEKALAEAQAQAEVRLHQLGVAQAEMKALEADIEKLRSASEQTRLQLTSEADAARASWQREMEENLTKAREEWKAAEAVRLTSAEAQWNTQLASAAAGNTVEVQDLNGILLQTQVELQTVRDSSQKELRKLRDELDASQISLAALESELAGVRAAAEQAHASSNQSADGIAAEIEKARLTWQKEADEILAQAKAAWLANEETRVAASVAAKVQSAPAEQQTELSQKLQATESALADANGCTDALRRELLEAQSSLSHRELELAEARAMIEQERDRVKHAPISAPERKPRWEVDEEERKSQFRRRLVRDLAIVSCLAGLGFFAYPRVQPVVADAFPKTGVFNDKLQPFLQMAGLAKPPPPPPVVEPHALVDVRIANLRAQPSTGAAVVTRLARNMEVTTVEHRGKWVFVRVGDGANQQQGWVASSVLKDKETAGSTGAE